MIFFWKSVSPTFFLMMVSGLRRRPFKGEMRGMRQTLVLVQREGAGTTCSPCSSHQYKRCLELIFEGKGRKDRSVNSHRELDPHTSKERGVRRGQAPATLRKERCLTRG